MAKDKKSKKAGDKLPKKLRKLGAKAAKLAEQPVVSEIVAAALLSAAAALRDNGRALPAMAASRRCPVCEGAPVVAALREEGHGARRVLICGLCASEWSFQRVQCPACEEGQFDALPVYTADGTEHVRVDAWAGREGLPALGKRALCQKYERATTAGTK